MKKVYLAGAITGATYEECTTWREDVAKELRAHDIQCASPLRNKEYLSNQAERELKDSYEGYLFSTPKAVVTRDRYDVTTCDMLFVNFLGAKRVSIGTILEIAWADSRRIPIVIVMEDNNLHQHAMIREIAGFVVPSIKDGIEIVKAIMKLKGE